jgi:hypothetical protein
MHRCASRGRGTIPASFGQLDAAETIYVDNNRLVGSLPDSMSRLTRLRSLFLENNRFAGELPNSFSSLRSLRELYAYNNSFTGDFPASWCSGMSQLVELILDHNQISSTIPADVGELTSLQIFSMAWNKLRGPVPPSLGEMHKLERLKLDHNDLTGAVHCAHHAPLPQGAALSVTARSTDEQSACAPLTLADRSALQGGMRGLCRHPSCIVQQADAAAHFGPGDHRTASVSLKSYVFTYVCIRLYACLRCMVRCMYVCLRCMCVCIVLLY